MIGDRVDEMAVASPRIFRELIGKPWFQSESVVISVDSWTIDLWLLFYHLLPMIYQDEATTFRIVGMPFLEAIDHRDIDRLETLRNLLESDPNGLQQILSLPALQDGITDDHSGTLPILYLESVDPEAAAAVRDLPWAQDDPFGDVELLRMLALESKRAFWAWMEQFGDDRIDGAVLERIITIASIDESAAIQILRMPFLETSEYADLVMMSFLADLSLSNLSELQQILSHPELSDGITDDRMATAVLLCLGIQDPDMADAIDALPWVRDGIGAPAMDVGYGSRPDLDETETETFWDFVEYSQRYSQLVLEMTRKQWIQDRISQSEKSALNRLFIISGNDEAAAVQVLGMPFLETVSPRDTIILETLSVLEQAEGGNVQQVLSNPALRGGIGDAQEGVVALLSLELQDPDAAAAIHDLSWVQDGIAASEQDDVLALQESALESNQIFFASMRKAWVHDGLTQDELSVIGLLTAMSGVSYTDRDEAAAMQILEMPFLEVVDGVDAAAVESLQTLSTQGYLRQVLSHSTLREGITNDLAIVVGMLDIVIEKERPDFLDTILNPTQITIEKRTISLPHSGDVDLAVVHASPGEPNSMDLLEYAVRSHEEFMATPLPKTYVGLLVLPFGGGGGGPNAVLFIEGGYREPGGLIAHEAAHIYWPFPPTWIAEGAASFMEKTTENALTGIQGELYHGRPCELADNLSDLERIEFQLQFESGFTDDETVYRSSCNYSLGSKLFAGLYESLGREMFREGFRNLYLRMLEESYGGDTECTGAERGVCSVKTAFMSDLDAAAIAEPIINRWYYGSEDGPP